MSGSQREALELALRAIFDDDGATSAAQIVLDQGWLPPTEAVRAVVERYGRVWAKDTDYYAAAEALGIVEQPEPPSGVLGRCAHGVDLDREFCPEGCRV